MNLSGKVALVTGSARRVGRAIALELAHAGCDLAIHYHQSQREAEDLRGMIHGLNRRAVIICGDLGDARTPDSLVGEVHRNLGRLDVLVNSASTFDKRPLSESDEAFWLRTLQVNLLAPALLARAAAPLMQASGSGRIVNLGDTLAERPPAGFAAYCTSKAALQGLTRALAIELAPMITVNAVAPGIAEFPESYDEATRQRHIGKVPLKRAGTPEEVARLVRWLVAEGDYISGQVIAIDGGRSLKSP